MRLSHEQWVNTTDSIKRLNIRSKRSFVDFHAFSGQKEFEDQLSGSRESELSFLLWISVSGADWR